MFGLKFASDPQLSPDGERVVYSVSKVCGDCTKAYSDVWISNRDGSDARRLTRTGDRNGNARWSPDGSRIAYVSGREGKSVLCVLRLDGGEAEPIATHHHTIGTPNWSPDGNSIAYSAVTDPEFPDGPPSSGPAPIRFTDRLDYKQDTRGYLAEKRAQIFVADVAARTTRQLTSDRDDHIMPIHSPDGTKLAFIRLYPNAMRSQLEILDLASGSFERVTADEGSISYWLWYPDSQSLLVFGELAQDQQTDFFVQAADGSSWKRLTQDFEPTGGYGFGVGGGAMPITWLDAKTALFTGATRGRRGLWTIDVTNGEITEEKIWNQKDNGAGFDASGRYVAMVYASNDGAGEVEIYDRQTGEKSRITSFNAARFEETPVGEMTYHALERNRYTIDYWILKPADFDASKTYPVVMNIHGGPHGYYGWDFSWVDQALAGAGYVVVLANPRGSGSYGGDFARQVVGDWGGEDYLDLMAVMDAVEELPYVDATRTGVFGYSYGGFMSSWIVGHTDRFKTAVIGSPVVDLISFFGTADIGHCWGEYEFGGLPWTNNAWYVEHSPITHAHKSKTPAMIIHSEGDDRVPIGQGEQLFATLKKIGLQTEFVRYPGGHHLFMREGEPAYRLDALKRILDWFGRTL
ncbi:MAG: S9 family peptidase [Thermomicrobiales bacterium]|nr:S9 family peptidase [Thermomicrobiales bacterium]